MFIVHAAQCVALLVLGASYGKFNNSICVSVCVCVCVCVFNVQVTFTIASPAMSFLDHAGSPSLMPHTLHQWSPTLDLQMFLDFSSQKFWPVEVVVKISGSCSPRTSGGPRLGTTALHHIVSLSCDIQVHCSFRHNSLSAK